MRLRRRQWLALLAWAVSTPALAGRPSVDRLPSADAAVYLSARRRAGRHEAVLIDAAGQDLLTVPMPDRGHSFAIDAPRGRAVVFGRQPGFFAVAFDLAGRHAPLPLAAAEGRHFFGHGAYSADGRRLYATENDYDNGRAVLGVYDAESGTYARLGDIDVGGVGSHEVILMQDQRTLCVANGGILTHPDYGKLDLNPDGMAPSLVYIDAASGRLIDRVELGAGLNRLSIRHLVQAGDGAVWFGCQHVGPAHERPPLVGRHRPGQPAELFDGRPGTTRALDNYIGSVALEAGGRIVATSSPVGGRIVYWDAASGAELGQTEFFDGCGVASAGQGRFLCTSGSGAMLRATPQAVQQSLQHPGSGLAWDNHLRRLPDSRAS